MNIININPNNDIINLDDIICLVTLVIGDIMESPNILILLLILDVICVNISVI